MKLKPFIASLLIIVTTSLLLSSCFVTDPHHRHRHNHDGPPRQYRN